MTFVPRLPPYESGMRIGLLGGSFNPPHDGHRLVTRLALTRLGLDRVWWLVTPGNPLKSKAELAALQRAGRGRAAADRRTRGWRSPTSRPQIGARYTYDTLAWLVRRAPGVAVRLADGRRQPAPVPPLAALAGHRRPLADRGHRPAGIDAERHVEPGGDGARPLARPRTRRQASRRSPPAGLPVPARAAIGLVVDAAAPERAGGRERKPGPGLSLSR